MQWVICRKRKRFVSALLDRGKWMTYVEEEPLNRKRRIYTCYVLAGQWCCISIYLRNYWLVQWNLSEPNTGSGRGNGHLRVPGFAGFSFISQKDFWLAGCQRFLLLILENWTWRGKDDIFQIEKNLRISFPGGKVGEHTVSGLFVGTPVHKLPLCL